MKIKRPETSRISNTIMEKSKLFIKSNGRYNLIQLRTHLQQQGTLDVTSILQMIDRFTNIISTSQSILEQEPNVMNISTPVTIIGDIHGQYYDFLKILTKIKNVQQPLNTNILFLGDYVDRGINSVQVITFIMAFKINNPKRVFLLRGNHQSRCMTTTYNFMREVLNKYNQSIYQRFMEAFDTLPLTCLINKNYFCVHGGISDKIINISKINQINRFQQIPLDGPFCDFIWSDPIQLDTGQMNQPTSFNSSRQCSIYFGKNLTKKFLQTNNIKCIIRAHQVFPEGYKHYYWEEYNKKYPTVVTVFSAPNYCGVFGNKGAIIKIDGTNFQIKQYKQQLINSKLYNYLQVFQWSIPQVIRVFNQFTKAMMISIFQIYLKDDFIQVKNAPSDAKLYLLMKYIRQHTNIITKQQNNQNHSNHQPQSNPSTKRTNHTNDTPTQIQNRFHKITHDKPNGQ